MSHLTTTRRILVALVPALLLAAASVVPADADQTGPSRGTKATGWYLALGDSLAAGYQPDRGEDRTGGYVGPVLDAVRQTEPKTKLVNLACSGESTTSMIDGSHCVGAYDEGSQLAQAVEFLHAHGRKTRLVTVTLGSNDVTPCLQQTDVAGCAQQRLTTVHTNLRAVLGAIHDAAPGVPVVVTNYYNPYLALWFDPARRALVPLTSALQAQLNSTIAAATNGYGSVADVATAFRSYDATPLPTGVPTNVATVCVYTWMCTWNPANIHATTPGYQAMAGAVEARL